MPRKATNVGTCSINHCKGRINADTQTVCNAHWSALSREIQQRVKLAQATGHGETGALLAAEEYLQEQGLQPRDTRRLEVLRSGSETDEGPPPRSTSLVRNDLLRARLDALRVGAPEEDDEDLQEETQVRRKEDPPTLVGLVVDVLTDLPHLPSVTGVCVGEVMIGRQPLLTLKTATHVHHIKASHITYISVPLDKDVAEVA